MARNKKEEPEYDVKIGFVHEFIVHDERYADRMNGHPAEGRVYRLIKDPQGYRLHIGRENNDANLDGIFLGHELEGEQRAFSYRIEIITPENYLKLPIKSEDVITMASWITNDNKDLWDNIERERSGEIPVVRTQADLVELMGRLRQEAEEREREESKGTAVIVPYNPNDIDLSREHKIDALETALNTITMFKNKSTNELLDLFDGLYERILKITKHD